MSEMNEEKGYKTDCEVCTRLIKEKHRFSYVWKIACVILAALVVILSVLYFGSGAMYTETTYTLYNNIISAEGDNGTIIIGSDGAITIGSSESIDYAPIICISIIVAAAIIVTGGIIIAYHHKKSD